MNYKLILITLLIVIFSSFVSAVQCGETITKDKRVNKVFDFPSNSLITNEKSNQLFETNVFNNSDACPAVDIGTLPSDDFFYIYGDTTNLANDFENDGYDCSYGEGGNDEIWKFTVGQSGYWQFDTMCVGWDTSLMVREEVGSGCPGLFHECDGDGGHHLCGNYESEVYVFLAAGTTYYLIVDGWSPVDYGEYVVSGCQGIASCVDDPSCDDGTWCNGREHCEEIYPCSSGCFSGTPPCQPTQICDEATDTCVGPLSDPIRKNRYISFMPGHSLGNPVAFKITTISNPLFPETVGYEKWVGQLDEYGVSALQCEPYFAYWNLTELINVGDKDIVPNATYLIEAVEEGISPSPSINVSTVENWGDIVGHYNNTLQEWTSPNGVVNFDDIQAMIITFEGVNVGAPLTWVDIADGFPDRTMNMGDVQHTVLAFEGGAYPFEGPSSCDSNN